MKLDDVSTVIREILGRNVKALREEAGVSQTALARMSPIDRGRLIKLEKGRGNVTVDVLVKLADSLDVPITALFEGVDDAPPRMQVEKPHIKYHGVTFPEDDRS